MRDLHEAAHVAKHRKVVFNAALAIHPEGELRVPEDASVTLDLSPSDDGIRSSMEVTKSAPPLDVTLLSRAPDATWPVRTAEGDLACYLCLWSFPDGQQQVRAAVYGTNEGMSTRWWTKYNPSIKKLFETLDLDSHRGAVIVIGDADPQLLTHRFSGQQIIVRSGQIVFEPEHETGPEEAVWLDQPSARSACDETLPASPDPVEFVPHRAGEGDAFARREDDQWLS